MSIGLVAWRPRLPLSYAPRATFIYMKGKPKQGADQEPMGIIISRGSQLEQAPLFAYVWAPAPEPTKEPRETKVA